ncbi:MAG: zinc-finger domain-containing protein [Alphaproteobacteria bacterium]|nr:zinc-finger domain-containing protein [Alphaproteobacteria bacterium]
MAKADVVTVTTASVECAGTEDAGGHPRVSLKIDAETREAHCPYCSRIFKLHPDAKLDAGH